MADIEKALLDPASVFKGPRDVLHREDLTREQKIKILRRWEYDARQLQVATEESMRGPEPVALDQVLNALRELDAGGAERSAPTKHGGK